MVVASERSAFLSDQPLDSRRNHLSTASLSDVSSIQSSTWEGNNDAVSRARSPSPEFDYIDHDRQNNPSAEGRDDAQLKGGVPANARPPSAHPSDSDPYLLGSTTERKQNRLASWLPRTFGHLYLGALSILALLLCLVVILLLWRSETNYGLGNDHGTSAVLFGWRFSPTLVAVIYIQFTAMLFDDVKRTEPYARLARPEGAAASPSILQAPEVWWNALRDGFSKKKNGGRVRSWILVCAALVNVLGFLVISPLSSALLTSEDVAVPHDREFARLTPRFNSPLFLDTDRTTRFRTISHALQNVSTSPWITDNYTMLPVWPADWPSVPIGSLSSTSSQSWQVETTVFRSNLTCDKMSLEHTSGYDNKTDITLLWSSPAGCTYRLHVQGDNMFSIGGGSWSNASTFIYTNYLPYVDPGSNWYQVNNTGDCRGHEILLLSESWRKKPQAAYSAHLCTTKYYMANVTASVDLSSNEPSISFDEGEYNRRKTLIPERFLNTTQLNELALSSYWASYMISMLYQNDMPILGGPAILLGASYGFNVTDILHDPNLIQRAGEIKQRFFGEALQASATHQGASQSVPASGQVTAFEKRVVVVKGTAITLAVLLFLSFCLLLVVWRCSRLRQRPLNLKADPATTSEVASLVTHDSQIRSAFSGLSVTPKKEMEKLLQGRRYQTEPQALFEIHDDNSEPNGTSPEVSKSDSARPSSWIPGVLRLMTLLGLVISLAAVIVGIAVLYYFAEDSQLYQKFFVYQANISIFNKNIPAVAPFSIIPTLIAVGIGLWWSAIDENFRRLQPFLAMSNGQPKFSQGVSLSYQSSYWVWAATKAARNQHWLLFLVTLGATLTPIFTTAMSALFERESGNIAQTLTLQRGLEIRRIPFLFETRQSEINHEPDEYAARIVGDLFQNLSTHWMYTASNQLILNGSQPAWSKDGWSFVPLDLSNATDSLSSVGKNASSSDLGRNLNQQSATHASPFNVSFTTPAIRGRIECSSYGANDLRNLSSWLSLWNPGPNDTVVPEGVSGFELGAPWGNQDSPGMIFPPEPGRNWTNCEHCTSIYVNPSQIICCGNSTSSPSDSNVAVGYWSPNLSPYTWTPRTWGHNFTAKWFTGTATPVTLTKGISDPMDRLVFSQPPNTVVMNCMPLVESADARITVNPSTGDIQTFSILDEPETMDDAFSDNFLVHNGTHRDPDDLGYLVFNATISYGRLFMSSMLTAASTLNLAGNRVIGFTTENTDDNTYTIRDETNGLNMDFMTYSMYSLAGKDPSALIDPDTFLKYASQTFTTFFQHFASNNISLTTGSWAYQPINASLPHDLAPAVDDIFMPSSEPAATQDVIHPISHTNRTVTARATRRVELLRMNDVAVGLSIGILGWLILTTAVVALLQRRFLGRMMRNVDCMGDVLVLIAGSENLIRVVREVQAGRASAEDTKNLRTKLGWFLDQNGEVRWGIELERQALGGPEVEWLDGPQDKPENHVTTAPK
ncbi:hypothetical protein P170DRAFT_39733 [Aspergillus steynii IBT 23096]|uniref:Uncharacterized protein n=1 Tax=Aspergillus steynii IBT 23096 TaxID=1392250 RepID=A0A2I2GR83_9EURO|nr:uncharacterized protein P170DRAFT_39733 [Aspergillus steynii IBT 23096]PLB55395.1 hypothetical protein P170DRAFT_39733 [Aspergillus steynii IBT 23096]